MEAFKSLKKAGEELSKYYSFVETYFKDIKEEGGFPAAVGSFAWAPFDLVGDTMRGTYGI